MPSHPLATLHNTSCRSDLPEGAFAKVLLAVRGRAKRWAGQRAAAPADGSPARMGAFFLLLRDRLGLLEPL
jgi:hypothetical protein